MRHFPDFRNWLERHPYQAMLVAAVVAGAAGTILTTLLIIFSRPVY